MGGWTGCQRDDGWMDRPTDTMTYRRTVKRDRQTGGWMVMWTDRQTDSATWTDSQTDGCMVNIKRSCSKLVGTRRSTVLILPLQ
jgi:hypothetical protein